MIMPLSYEVGLLQGICRLLLGRDRPPDAPTLEIDTLRALPLPNTNTRGPPKEWIAEHGKTPRCRACKIKGFDSDKALHTPACRARYAKFLKESFNPEATIAQDREIDKEMGFDPPVPDLGDLGFEGLGDYVELPRDDTQRPLQACTPKPLTLAHLDPRKTLAQLYPQTPDDPILTAAAA